jgi:hypothetical protein
MTIADLTPDQETQARHLAEQLKENASEQFLAIARRLVATDERTLFGQTEFDLRDEALKVVGKAYTLHLAQKKTAIAAPPSIAPSATKRRRITANANEIPKASEV